MATEVHAFECGCGELYRSDEQAERCARSHGIVRGRRFDPSQMCTCNSRTVDYISGEIEHYIHCDTFTKA